MVEGWWCRLCIGYQSSIGAVLKDWDNSTKQGTVALESCLAYIFVMHCTLFSRSELCTGTPLGTGLHWSSSVGNIEMHCMAEYRLALCTRNQTGRAVV